MNRDQLAAVFVRNRNSLFKRAFALTRNVDDAEDLLSSALVRALQASDLCEDRGEEFVVRWFSVVIKRMFLNDQRSRRVRRVNDHRSINDDAFTEQIPDPYRVNFAARQVVQKVERQLDDKFKKGGKHALDYLIIRYAAFDGMSYEEMSELLQIPVGTVRSRLSRYRERLAKAVGGRDAW